MDNLVETKQNAETTAPFADTAASSVATSETAVLTQAAPEAATMTTQAAVASSTPLAPAAATLDIFVATNGNDAWTGTLASANVAGTDGPKRTITAAQGIVRQRLAAMAAGGSRLPINVRIASGEYRLSAPLSFGPADSGIAGAPVVYRAEVSGTVTLSGAMRAGAIATGPAAGTLVGLPTPSLDASNMLGGSQLYVNGRRATLARTPNVGSYWFVQKAVPLVSEPVASAGAEAFVPPPEALTLLNGLSAADRSQAVVNVMQAWTSGWHRVSASAAPAGSVRISPRAAWPFLSHGTDQRFYVENVAAALDAPGEWLWDTSGMRYIATAADSGKSLAFDLPQLDKLLVVSGNKSTRDWVHDLEFRGLGFAYTRQLTPAGGYVDNQAGSGVGAAVEVDSARRVVIDTCTVSHTGGYGVWLRGAVRDSQVSNCRMSDLGAGGVKVGLTAQSPTDVDGTGNNTVRANSITDTGKVVPGAVGVWVGQSADNTVANNLIANTTYSGISVGWVWVYGTATASRNRITNNLLINIGLGEMSDMGGIYTAGESPGTVISGNVIHEVRGYPSYGAGAWGLYNDAASTGVVWERNVVVGTNDGGYLLHYGRNNIVRKNVLAFGDRGEVRVTRSDPTLTKLEFSNNYLIPKNVAPLVTFATAPDVIYTGNVVSSSVLATPPDIVKCGGGCARSTTMLTVGADPRVLTLSGADGPSTASVALIGANAGPPGLAAAAIPTVNGKLPDVVVAPPIGYETGIAETAIGGRPVNLKYQVGNNTTAISVQTAAGTPSGKCLRFADSSSFAYRWEPYAYAQLNHTKGTTTVEFSIKIDAGSSFWHEWRDDANVYLGGPSVRIKATGIEVAGKVVAAAPIGQWITLRISAALDTGSARWQLETKYGTGAFTTVGNYANRNTDWKRLNWLGFVSDAGTDSTACLGYIKANSTAS